MKTFWRITVLGIFAAVGVGLALCVVHSTEPEPAIGTAEDPSKPVARADASPDDTPDSQAQAAADHAEPGASDDAGMPPAQTAPLRVPAGPVLAEASPHRAAQAGPSDFENQLLDGLNFIRQRLSSQPGQAPQPGAARPGSTGPMLPATGAAGPKGSGREAVAAPAPAPPAAGADVPPKKEITRGDLGEGDGHLSINIQKTDIREVLELLAEQGNLNILASNSVQGSVSASLKDVDVDSALEAILRSTGYVAKRDGKFIFVGTADDFKQMEHSLDEVGTRIYQPNYITANELQTLIQPILTETVGVVSVTSAAEQGIGSDDASAGGDSYAGGDAVLVRDYEAVLAQIDQIVASVDVRPLQVHIEAMILSVKLDDSTAFGVNFEILRDKHNVRMAWGAPTTDLANIKLEKGALKFGFLDSSLSSFLEALETVGETNVIATPRLMVLNKHKAEIQIGEKKGYISTTVTETSSTQNVEFLDIGALLRLRPFVSRDGLIRMEVHPELSDGDVKEKGQFTLPEKEVTEVTTNIMVRDGCTVIIGGLMREQLTKTGNQVPFLGSLPWVGVAFRDQKETVERREVLVLITPRIVYEPETCAEGAQGACEFHRRQATYFDKMNVFGKRSLGKKYFRLAQNAWAAGDRKTALRFAEMAVHFNPLDRRALDLRAAIWQGRMFSSHTISGEQAPAPDRFNTAAADASQLPAWLLEELEHEGPPIRPPEHPLDPGVSGGHRDIKKPRVFE
jgi:type IV pilus assembly protein PilQ